MRSKRLAPARYQLKKEAIQVVRSGHPWIFRSHLSTAANVFKSGQWLKLVDAENGIAGYGIYDTDGLIGVRMLKEGKNAPDAEWIDKIFKKALTKRQSLKKYTDAYRVMHGENDGFPGVVLDVYGKTGVLQTYARSVDTLGRYLGEKAARELGLEKLIWKSPSKRVAKSESATEKKAVRALRGNVPRVEQFKEGKLTLSVDIAQGQKSGTFLDLRGLRKWLSLQNLNGKRVLNLFSYSGTLGLACEIAGAAEIWNVDISDGALEFAKKHHTRDVKKHRFIAADVFEWLKKLPEKERFDLIIVDPPQLASQQHQVPNALKAFRNLHRSALQHLKNRGMIVTCCCTSRIARKRFQLEAESVLAPELRLIKSILPEDDHPVGFPEGDYLKILIFGW
jgi:23S rRNA (cytosine1962-C5)-methyltransferase